MAASYKKLFKLLIDRNMKKKDLQQLAGLSPASVSKLAKDEYVSMEVLVKVCSALKVDIGDTAQETVRQNSRQIRRALQDRPERNEKHLCHQNLQGRYARRLQSKGGRVDAEREPRLNSEIEHVRWSSYMLTEGFVYSETKDSRFKMHSDLVPVEALMLTDYMKDI